MIRSLSLMVDAGVGDTAILHGAMAFAKRQDAALAIDIVSVAPMPGYAITIMPPAVTLEDAVAKNDAKQAAAQAEANRHDIDVDIRILSDTAVALLDTVPARAHATDLIVFGARDTWEDPWVARRIMENVVLGSGRPVLLLPADGKTPSLDHAVVGWNGSSEATRALHAAMAYLAHGAAITIALIRPNRHHGHHDETQGEDMCAGLIGHLSRHGFRAHIVEVHAESGQEAEALAQIARKHGADLIVTGAYGHSRLREVLLGGVTQDFLAGSDIPVLLMH